MRETTRVPRLYELMIIVAPDVSEDELPVVIDRVGGYISSAGGTLSATLRESPWGRRRLAYAIRHGGRDVRDGYYTVYRFDAPPAAIAEVERELRLTDQVMRFLVTHFIPQPVSEQVPQSAEEAEAQASAVATAEAAEAPAALEIERPAVEEPEAAEAEAPASEEVAAEAEPAPEIEVPPAAAEEAPVKKRAPRRKKTETPDEAEEHVATPES
ncbi:MAG: 30S ribosomal protein S6 [Thermomicrobiales bacterium]